MGADLKGFDARTVEPMDTFEPIPAGKYVAAIVASEMKPTRAGDGSYLELQFQLLEGPHKGRLLWSRLNLNNANELAVKIARAQLAAVCRATGVLTPNDSTELHNLPLTQVHSNGPQVLLVLKRSHHLADSGRVHIIENHIDALSIANAENQFHVRRLQ